jgi:hypothetical protein
MKLEVEKQIKKIVRYALALGDNIPKPYKEWLESDRPASTVCAAAMQAARNMIEYPVAFAAIWYHERVVVGIATDLAARAAVYKAYLGDDKLSGIAHTMAYQHRPTDWTMAMQEVYNSALRDIAGI